MDDFAFHAYWKNVSERLTCSRKIKQQFHDEAYMSVQEYLSDCADEDFSVESFLGTPDELAATLMGTLDEAEIEKARIKNRWKPRIIAAVAVLCATIPFVVAYLWTHPLWVTVEEKTIIYPEQKISDEDLQPPQYILDDKTKITTADGQVYYE